MSNEVENNVVENESFVPTIDVRGQKFDFTYNIEDVDKFTKKYVIKVDGDLFRAMEREAYYATKGKYAIPGFRNGKAPIHAIKSYYGEEVFLESTVDQAIDSIYRVMYSPVFLKANMAASPEVEIRKISKTEMEYAYVITVFPEVGEVNYKGLEIHCYDEDKYVKDLADKKLTDAREKAGSWENIEGRSLQEGDTANIDYLGKIDDVPFEGGAQDGCDLVIGSNTFIPGFESQLVGMNVGETKDINVTFPEDYHQELAGKNAVFTVKLNSIKMKSLPELNDDFAKDVSEFDTLDELKASYEEAAKEEGHKQVVNLNNNAIVDAVLKNAEYDVPEKTLTESAEDQLQKLEDQLKTAGLTFDQYAQYTGYTKEKILDEYKASTAEREKKNMVLSAIIEREGIKLEKEDVENAIQDKAAKAGKDVEDYKKEMKNDEFDYIVNQILSDKLLARLAELNNLVYDK